MIPDALVQVLKSRKNWHFDAGVIKAVLTKVIFGIAIYKGWTPEKSQLAIDQAGHLVALAFLVGGAINAFLTAAEDFARKWGVTDSLPAELALTGARTVDELPASPLTAVDDDDQPRPTPPRQEVR